MITAQALGGPAEPGWTGLCGVEVWTVEGGPRRGAGRGKEVPENGRDRALGLTAR